MVHYSDIWVIFVSEILMITFWCLIDVIQIYIITIGEIWHTTHAFYENSFNSLESNSSISQDIITKIL